MAALDKARPFGLALLFASVMIPSLAHGQCLPEEKSDSTTFRFYLSATCTEEEKRRYPIQSKDVVEAIESGKAIDIENAVIQGPFTLRSITVEQEVSIKRTKFMDLVDWAYATVRRVLTLDGNTFANTADFTGAAIEKDLSLKDATFEREANFSSSRIEGQAEFTRAQFRQGANFNVTRIGSQAIFLGAVFKQGANFNGAQLDGGALFRPAISGKEVRPVYFEGTADFVSVRIGVQAEFDGAVFKQEAKFNHAQILGSAFFRPAISGKEVLPVRFEGPADFRSARIGGQAEFDGAVFKQEANFNSAQIQRSAFFRVVIFEGERPADFEMARIGNQAEFDGAVFKQEAKFNGAKIDGNALFRDAIFVGEAGFRSMRLGGVAVFDGAAFKQGVSFSRARIDEGAFFRNVSFEGKAYFMSARLGSAADFAEARFKQEASFHGAHIEGSVFFKAATFDKDLDFQGFVYSRIDVSWEDLKGRLNPQDSQVYAQLETAFRQSGKSATAFEVYYKSRQMEGDKIEFKREKLRWLNDRKARWLVDYGKDPFRLLWLSLFFIGIGTLIFRKEGAVEPKEREKCPLHSGSQCVPAIHRLPYGLAFWVSLNAFLPGAEVTAANAWGPTPSRYWIQRGYLKITYAGFATILRIVGWFILVLGFSALPDFLLR